jgi:hypothetical protein
MATRTAALVFVLAAVAATGCDRLKGSSSDKSGGSAAPAVGGGTPTSTPAAAPGTGAVVTGDPIKTPCDLKATDFATTNHAELGKPILVSCPTACADGAVWGTDVYTDDSAVCRALVHAGAFPSTGGKGAITFARSQLTYVGSQRNGIESQDYGKWGRSFYAQAVDDQNRTKGAAPTIYDDHSGLVKCGVSNPFSGSPGEQFTAICTTDCTEGSVWGSNPYTSDSGLCTAGHHAGIIKGGSLKMKVTLGGAKDSFKGSAANGVTSQDYGPFGTTITLAKAE